LVVTNSIVVAQGQRVQLVPQCQSSHTVALLTRPNRSLGCIPEIGCIPANRRHGVPCSLSPFNCPEWSLRNPESSSGLRHETGPEGGRDRRHIVQSITTADRAAIGCVPPGWSAVVPPRRRGRADRIGSRGGYVAARPKAGQGAHDLGVRPHRQRPEREPRPAPFACHDSPSFFNEPTQS
jgi:hypothetical protein